MNEENITKAVEIIGHVIAVASVISAATPTPKDDGILFLIKKILSIFAFNFGYAKVK